MLAFLIICGLSLLLTAYISPSLPPDANIWGVLLIVCGLVALLILRPRSGRDATDPGAKDPGQPTSGDLTDDLFMDDRRINYAEDLDPSENVLYPYRDIGKP